MVDFYQGDSVVSRTGKTSDEEHDGSETHTHDE